MEICASNISTDFLLERLEGHKSILGEICIQKALDRLLVFAGALSSGNQTWNDRLLDPEILRAEIPTATKHLAVLGTCWKRHVKLNDLAKIGSQIASQCRDLRLKYGVIFGGDNRKYVEHHPVLGPTRRIHGFGRKFCTRTLISVSAKEQKNFLKGKRDPITGSTNNLEIDHRTPIAAALKAGRAPDILTKEDIESGMADELFQALSRSTNTRKREICAKCLQGQDIDIPPVATWGKPANYWRQRFYDERAKNLPDDASPCLGCFWHRPEHSFEEALAHYWQRRHASE